MTRVLFTGSRDWPDDDAFWVDVIVSGLLVAGMTEASVGDCRTGVDHLIRQRLQPVLNDRLDIFEAEWDRCQPDHPIVPCYHRPRANGNCPAAGPRRNQTMVDAGGDLCVAFHDGPLHNSRGTYDCARRAAIAGIEVVTVGRDMPL